uniref:non-specific serine/threonine protein kinase n=1 Tax=Chenopodium quinoa TaxID=63459 RepID=A0A803L156_CHEQI
MNLHFFLCSFLLLFTITSRVHSLSPDGLALLSLKSAVDHSSSSAIFADWDENDPDPCGWTGVSCDGNSSSSPNPRVVGISVAGKNLRGYIPSELGSLSSLRRLNLHGNSFYGSIPDQIFNATSLHSIFLYGNNLSGPLPTSMCSLPRIQNVDVSGNSLSGEIPNGLKECKQLQRLILARNNFSGELPGGIWHELVYLVQLDLSSNQIQGKIPEELGELKLLSGTLNLSFNHLSGKIPKSLGDLPMTVSFDLRANNLTEEIPQTGSFANQGPTAFLGNPLLCGFPLQKDCTETTPNPNSPPPEDSRGISPKGGSPSNDIESESDKGSSEGGEGGGEGGGELVAIDKGFTFELDELLRASAYVLGKSGLGIVYKVVLGNGVPVAVRRLGEGGDQQRYKEFVAEIQAIGKIKHPNVVKLRAYYRAPDEKLLISDFISNGNLGNALRGRTGQPSTSLTWKTRLKIAKGTARGLANLHECSPRKFVHGDIKPSNILLDNEFQPHISDFGLNRLISIAGNNPSSSGGFMGGALPYVKSTSQDKINNYRAPEAKIPGSRPTQKWDVYSFGVVVLELLTGKSPEHSSPTTSTSTEIHDLVKWVRVLKRKTRFRKW